MNIDQLAVQTENISDDAVLHRGPCLLYWVHGTQDGEDGVVKIYDGWSTTGKLKGVLELGSSVSRAWSPKKAVKIENGLFIDVDANVSNVTVQFEPLYPEIG